MGSLKKQTALAFRLGLATDSLFDHSAKLSDSVNNIVGEKLKVQEKKYIGVTGTVSDYKTSKPIQNNNKVGRNDPCSCGSGIKFKKCCYGK